MVKAIALEEIIKDGKVVGYKLQDRSGGIMNVPSTSIIEAIKNNKIAIENLDINSDGKLEMKSNKKEEPTPCDNTTMHNNDASAKRIYELVTKLNEAAKVYEQGTDEIMSNFEYDKLYDELLELEKQTGIVLSNSPTQNVGYEVVSELPKDRHETAMLSLDKTKDRQSLVGWLNGKDGVLSWKMDGLTVVLHYNEGKLVKAVTRGNGEVGEIVTPNAKQFVNVPRKIPYMGKLVIRGEAIITYDDFDRINSSITLEDDKFKNPRNLCSGSVRQLDSSVTKARNVRWYAFGVVSEDIGTYGNDTEKMFQWLKLNGFECVDYIVVNPSNILQAIEKFYSMLELRQTQIPTDGLVLTYKDITYGKSLGSTSKFPRHSIAFKWQDENVISRITGVEWSPSRTGLINPVALFEPVDIEGSTVSRASVHNVSIFSQLELGIGDRVAVYKANMIIPQISDNLDRTATCQIPGECPCCGEKTELKQDMTSGVYTLWCVNKECTAKSDKLLEHFVKRDCMNIDGISGSTLSVLSEYGIVDDFASIYHIKDHMSDIISIPGFGMTSFNNMVEAIEKSRNVKLANLIFALGIPNIGLSTAKVICKHFKNSLYDTLGATYEQLMCIDGIGSVIAQSFVNYFENRENAVAFAELIKELHIIKEEVSTNNSMAGITICVTGKVYSFSSRNVVKEVVEMLGGKLTSAVSASTTYLVTNDTGSGSAKNKAAQAYGIEILSEEQFIEKFNLYSYVK